jgi:hypothetical protein
VWGTKNKKMNRLFDTENFTKEYETRCDFQIKDSETRGEYTIYKDGTIETTCRRCKKQFVVNDKFATMALTKNEILEDALCTDCWKEDKKAEGTETQDNRRDQIHMGQAINLANTRYWAIKRPEEMNWELFDKYVDEYYQYIKHQNG